MTWKGFWMCVLAWLIFFGSIGLASYLSDNKTKVSVKYSANNEWQSRKNLQQSRAREWDKENPSGIYLEISVPAKIEWEKIKWWWRVKRRGARKKLMG